MARIYNTDSILGKIMEGGAAGAEIAAKRRDRKSDEDFRKAAALLGASQFAEGRYAKPAVDPKTGLPTGFQDDSDAISRDKPIIRSKLPDFFPQDATKPRQGYAGIPGKGPTGTMGATPSGAPMKEYGEDESIKAAIAAGMPPPPQPQVPPDPAPLLRTEAMSPASDLTDLARKIGKSQVKREVGDTIPTGRKLPDGTIETIQPVDQATIFDDALVEGTGSGEAPVPAQAAQPPPAEAPPDFNPSRGYLARLADYTTGAGAKEGLDRETAIGSLPEELQRIVQGKGPDDPITPEEQRITLKDSLLKGILDQRLKAGASSSKDLVAPELYDLAGQVEEGILPIGAARGRAARLLGRQLNKREDDLFEKAAERKTKGMEFDRRDRADEEKARIAREKEEAAKKKADEQALRKKTSQQASAAVVNDEIGRVLEIVRGNPGYFGHIMGRVGENTMGPAKRAADMFKTIAGNVSFDKLQAMREASPTGGALGQVSDFENRLLQATMGNISASVDAKDLEYNLKRLHDIYNDVVFGVGMGPERFFGQSFLPDSIQQAHREALSGAGSPSGGQKPQGFKQTPEEASFLKIQSETSSLMSQIDASDKNPSEKRALKKRVADRYKEQTGVSWTRKDGSEVP